ncbi:MAG: MarR family transcriptional regulator [Bacilli bacterium]|jgi:DNA-binding MarR family transcriptional regulator|nr:MarR family transcriptional regulator [Bacilli bacterium]
MRKEEKPLGAEIRVTNNLIKAYIDRTLNTRLKENLTGIEGMILGFLFRHPDLKLTSKDIMDRSRGSKATTSQSVNGLVKKGYIEMVVSSVDHRKKIIHLTEKGIAVEGEFKEIFKGITAQIKNGVSSEEEALVRRILARIRDNVSGDKD